MATISAGVVMHALAVRAAPAVYQYLDNVAPVAMATLIVGAARPALAPMTAAAAIVIHQAPLLQDVNSAHFNRALPVFLALHVPVVLAITSKTALGFQARIFGMDALAPNQALKPPQRRPTMVK